MPNKGVIRKLLIKEGFTVAVVNAPKDYEAQLGPLPKGVKVQSKPTQATNLIQLFVANRRELEARLPKLKSFVSPTTLIWVCYLKGTSKTKTDINRDSLHAYARSIGLDGVTLVSIDDDWSAMRFKLG